MISDGATACVLFGPEVCYLCDATQKIYVTFKAANIHSALYQLQRAWNLMEVVVGLS